MMIMSDDDNDCCHSCKFFYNAAETYPCTECLYTHDIHPNWGTKWENKDPPLLKTRFEILKEI